MGPRGAAGAAWWVLVAGQCMMDSATGLGVAPSLPSPATLAWGLRGGPAGGPAGDPGGAFAGAAFSAPPGCPGAAVRGRVRGLEGGGTGPWRAVRCVGPAMMARKEFDKKYDKGFDDFRTSGSMPSIPNIAEQYSQAASFVTEKGVEVKEGDPAFGKRITEAQEALKREQEDGMRAYGELKAELLADTAYVCILGLAAFVALASEQTALSYGLGALGSLSYSFLLTRTADRMGEQGSTSSMFDPGTPLRFAILFFLIILAAKNKETLQILPLLFGFFAPYKLASLRPAFVSLPPIKDTEVRVFRRWLDSNDTPPFRIEYGAKVLGKDARRRTSFRPPDNTGTKTQGSSAPLGKRKIASIEEQYEALKKGTMD